MSAEGGITLLCAAALIAASSMLILKNLGTRAVPVLAAVAVAVFLSVGASGLGLFREEIGVIADISNISEYAVCASKLIGLGYLSSATVGICTELGECGIAKAFSVSARIEMLMIALPYFKELWRLGTELVGGGAL